MIKTSDALCIDEKKVSSTFSDLLALMFWIHILTVFSFGAWMVVQSKAWPHHLTVVALHCSIGIFSLLVTLATVVAERMQSRFLSNLVAKWASRVALLLILLAFGWSMAFPAPMMQALP